MAADFLELLVRANLAGGAAILAVLALRTPVARRFGARAAYACGWPSRWRRSPACFPPGGSWSSSSPDSRRPRRLSSLPSAPWTRRPGRWRWPARPSMRALPCSRSGWRGPRPSWAFWSGASSVSAGRWGAYLAAHPQYRNAARLSADLLPSGWNEAAQRRLRDRVAADFRAGRLFVHRGWRLSDTEGRLFALAALSEG